MNRKLVIAAVAASALAVGGTTAAFAGGTGDAGSAPAQAAQAQGDDRDDRDDRREDAAEAKALSGAQLSAKEAIDKALGTVNGQVESIELDDEDGRLAWEADVLGGNGTWHEVRVDADSGKVLKQQSGDDRQDDDRDDRDDRGEDDGQDDD